MFPDYLVRISWKAIKISGFLFFHMVEFQTGGFIILSFLRRYMKDHAFPLTGVVLIIITVTVFFAGCSAQTPSIPGQLHTPAATENSNPPVPGSVSYQDRELLTIGADSGKALGPVISQISDDASRKDITSLGADSARLSSLAGDYYFRMRDLNVSPKYQVWKTNYLLGLLDLMTAGDYFSKSAMMAQSNDYMNASIYLEQGNTLFQRSNHYLRTAIESVPN
jgi:hypothetical protein